MKLHFEPNLDYQLAAVEAVCALFKGQEKDRQVFSVVRESAKGLYLSGYEIDEGVGNRLGLLPEQVQKNLATIQVKAALPPTTLEGAETDHWRGADFTVEMETGTGKTYVYLRTLFELNQRYGFSKFVIVVPSVAIKEGVYKALQITEDHFKGLYAGVPFDYFLYDSSKMGQVRAFATSATIQVMVVTVGAINKKDVNNIYGKGADEQTGGQKPIDLIRAVRPIVIVDEPQSVDGGLSGAGKKALDEMHPLCTLRYSATHVDKHHMVHRLDAVDAYEKRLVKQIEVAAATVEQAYNRPYVKLLNVSNKRGVVSATVEVDVQGPGGVCRTPKTVYDGTPLDEITGSRPIYREMRVGEIRAEKGNEFLELRYPGGERFLSIGEAHGDIDALAVQREMIRRTIKEHLDKEKRLRPKGIKVLSLFFIDRVDKYRTYDAEGNAGKGEYARLFEEEYAKVAKLPDYWTLFKEVDLAHAAAEVHNGYFAVDKKKVGGKTVEQFKDTRGDSAADDDAYTLILRDKERLLSLETPLKFIFSHSALREGWDNPNVFQICSLRDIRTERERRQTLGRGLRLCVNQQGVRVRDDGVNTLTVIANESYQQFADNLQREIEADTGIRFGVVEHFQFAAIPVATEGSAEDRLGFESSKALWTWLREQKYLDAHGRVQDALRRALNDKTLALPAAYAAQKDAVVAVLTKATGRVEIHDADERRPVAARRAVLDGQEFRALWDRIKHQTTYRLDFDNETLIRRCVDAVREMEPVAKTRLQWRKAGLAIEKSGVEATERDGSATVVLDETDLDLPDLLTVLQDRTALTRRSLARILVESGRLNDFKRNPQAFIDRVVEAINTRKQRAIVDGIRYQRLGDEHYYAQELFASRELSGYLKHMLVETKKSVYEHVVYDSAVEADFADRLEKTDAVKVYAKLPRWFRVPTPLGDYIPDWAVLIENDGAERLYFVVETKASLLVDTLRETEELKIHCGREHFAALAVGDAPAVFKHAKTVDDLFDDA